MRLQIALCGASSFGNSYRTAIRQVANHLRLTIHSPGSLPDPVRDTLYRASRCVVYPSIHREPFGLVALEAMSQGTPVIVPDVGGIGELVQSNGKAGGLRFRSWDSGDLARKMDQVITYDTLHRELAANGPALASKFTLDRLTNELLAHVGLA